MFLAAEHITSHPAVLKILESVHLQGGKRVVLQEGQPDDRHQQELHAERVVLRVICVPEAHVDQVHGSIGQSEEHHLRAGSDIN